MTHLPNQWIKGGTARALYFGKGVHHLKVMTEGLSPEFMSKTLNSPWMRLKIFLDEGPLSRTPEHYKKFYYDWQVKTPSPVHYIPEQGNFKRLENEEIKVIQNRPLPLIYPHELHHGLWGGEAVIKGFEKRKLKRRRIGTYWVPKLHSSVVYSEILDKYMKLIVTERALRLIDDNYGLDSYILKTPPADLMSLLALRLKKEMIYALIDKTFYPDDEVRREKIYEQYKEFIISKEELEWYGLTLSEAFRKQLRVEAEEKNNIGPYKHIFRKEFIEHLIENKQNVNIELTINNKSGFLKRLNFFGKN